MYKGKSPFATPQNIYPSLSSAFLRLNAERLLTGLSMSDFSLRAAFYLGEINAIHPFREGNGRTQREFIRQLAVHAGHPLSWHGFSEQQMIDASVASHLRGDNSDLAAIIEAALFSSRQTP